MLDEAKNNYIASAYYQGDKVGICFADISTGELEATTLTAEKGETLSRAVIDALSRFTPREILINPDFTDLTDVAKFVSDKLSASLECMDFAVYEPLHAEETVKAQFHPEGFGTLRRFEFPGDHGGAERFARVSQPHTNHGFGAHGGNSHIFAGEDDAA